MAVSSCGGCSKCFGRQGDRDLDSQKVLPSRDLQLEQIRDEIRDLGISINAIKSTLGPESSIALNLRKQLQDLEELLASADRYETSREVRQVLNYKPSDVDAVYTVPRYPLFCAFKVIRGQGVDCRGYELSYRGKIIRQFLDTNSDRKLDLFIYFDDGVESYRESDRNFDGKLDAWQHTLGDSITLLFDSDDDGKADELFRGKASMLLTNGLRTAVNDGLLTKGSVGVALKAGKHELKAKFPPKNFVASIGGFSGASYKIVFDGKGCKYKHNPNGFTEWGGTTHELGVSENSWKILRDQLNDIELWKWQQRYENPEIHDGTVWEIEIETENQIVRSTGSNAGPGRDRFRAMLEALSKFAGGKTFE